MQATVWMCGDLQGTAGETLHEIEELGFKELEAPARGEEEVV